MRINGKEYLTDDRWLEYEKATFSTLFNICEGAVRSGKSVANCRTSADRIIACDHQGEALFLGCAVSESMAKALIGESDGFGLFHIFNGWARYGCSAKYTKYKGKDALRIVVRKNRRDYIRWVIFVGDAKSGDEKFIRGLTIQGAIVEEMNLMTKDFFDELLRRMAASSDPFINATMNPSMTKHWVYRDVIDNERLKKEMTHGHATLIDNPALTPGRIKEIESRYDKDSVQYKGYILGERMNPSGAIYHVREQNIIDSYDPSDYLSYVVVCDQGETISATAMTLGALRYDREKGYYTYDVLKEYHHINSTETGAGVKHFEEYAEDLADFVIESMRIMSRPPTEVIVDQDPEFYAQVVKVFARKGVDPYSVKFPYKREIEQRVKTGVQIMHKGQLRFHRDCTKTIEDYRNAQYDSKEIDKKGKFVRAKEYTEGFGHLDMIDSVEYGHDRYLGELQTESIETEGLNSLL